MKVISRYMDYAAATSLPLGIGGVLIYVKPLYRSSHREFNKTQIKRFRHSVRLCLLCAFFRRRMRLLVA